MKPVLRFILWTAAPTDYIPLAAPATEDAPVTRQGA